MTPTDLDHTDLRRLPRVCTQGILPTTGSKTTSTERKTFAENSDLGEALSEHSSLVVLVLC